MSFGLFYQLIPEKTPPITELPHQLKSVISRRWWDHDGTLRGEALPVTASNLSYFDGLADAGISGAAEIAQAVREHGRVNIWIGEISDSPF